MVMDERQEVKQVVSATAAARGHRVVIVGCGFGGLTAAKALARAAVEVTVIVN